MTPDTVGWRAKSVRSELRERGEPVPPDWKCNDRRTFEDCLARKINEEAETRFAQKVAERLGPGVNLPRDLEWEAFVRHPAVQRHWRSKLGLSGDTRLIHTMGLEEYRALAYTPRVTAEVRKLTDLYHAEALTFADGGANESAGKRAVRALLVPPIALCFSLLGGLVHVFKFSAYTLRFVSPWKIANWSVVSLTLFVVRRSCLLEGQRN